MPHSKVVWLETMNTTTKDKDLSSNTTILKRSSQQLSIHYKGLRTPDKGSLHYRLVSLTNEVGAGVEFSEDRLYLYV